MRLRWCGCSYGEDVGCFVERCAEGAEGDVVWELGAEIFEELTFENGEGLVFDEGA